MSIKEKPTVKDWLSLTKDEVLDTFGQIPSSYTDGDGPRRFVYVPGSRKDRALLVAHADTVWGNATVKLAEKHGIIYSADRFGKHDIRDEKGFTMVKHGIGIGADDRAGCAILWYLRNLGHSILITSGEENGCIGSNWLIADDYWQKELNDTHQFAVQFDRKNKHDIVFYDVATKDFVKYVQNETKYKPAQGSNTDIRVLCKSICGVNISVGYYDEHRSEERLCVDQWLNTLSMAAAWLSKQDLPKFTLDKTNLYTYTYNCNNNNNFNHCSNFNHNNNNDHRNYNQEYKDYNARSHDMTNTSRIADRIVQCYYCKATMTIEQWYNNDFKCNACHQAI